MRVSIRGFGPIRCADIDVRPLTVFVGPNAAGKSYLLYLLWALLSVEPDWDRLGDLLDRRVLKALSMSRDRDAVARELRDVYTDVLRGFGDIFRENLGLLLKDAFMVSRLGELVGREFERSEIVVRDVEGVPAIRIVIEGEDSVRVVVEDRVVEKIGSRLRVDVDARGSVLLATCSDGASGRVLRRLVLRTDDIYYVAESVGEVWSSVRDVMLVYLGYFPSLSVVILPDGRAGIIRTADPLARSMLSLRRGGDLEVSAVDRAFFRLMLTSSSRERSPRIAAIASFIERSLGYRFVYVREEHRMLVIDEARSVKLGIERAPSGIRELAPLIHAMRYVLSEGSYLMVEEPEAHLHPDAQSVVTRALAMLSRRGVNVVITTHSVHVLDEIHALLRIAGLGPGQRRELGYLEDEGLEPESVAVYMVSEDGSVARARITREGIEETFLDRVYRELANRYARIEQLLERSEARQP